MASVQDIKRRVASVRNTRKITKAMELVAAAKLRRAEARISQFRDYAETMRELMIGTARATPARSFPLMEARGRGEEVRWLVTGKKGRSTLRFRRYAIEDAWVDFTDRPEYAHAQAVAHRLAELFTSRDVDRVLL